MLYSFDDRKPRVGKDTYIGEHALVIGDVKIGDNCYIGHAAILRGDYGSIEIGSGTAVEEGVVIHAPPEETCHIGKKVTLGHGAIVHAHSIGDSALIGMGAVVSIWAEIGERTIVAEGCVIKMRQKIPAGVMVNGNPARIIRKVTTKDEKHQGWRNQLYIDLAKKYLEIGIQRLD
jgi:carbonic anhydrase/acetyltransferase-like protein (isoleucine patch superfamily)